MTLNPLHALATSSRVLTGTTGTQGDGFFLCTDHTPPAALRGRTEPLTLINSVFARFQTPRRDPDMHAIIRASEALQPLAETVDSDAGLACSFVYLTEYEGEVRYAITGKCHVVVVNPDGSFEGASHEQVGRAILGDDTQATWEPGQTLNHPPAITGARTGQQSMERGAFKAQPNSIILLVTEDSLRLLLEANFPEKLMSSTDEFVAWAQSLLADMPGDPANRTDGFQAMLVAA